MKLLSQLSCTAMTKLDCETKLHTLSAYANSFVTQSISPSISTVTRAEAVFLEAPEVK